MTEAQHIALDKELAKLFKKMSSESFGVAKGANHQMLSVINRSLADNIVEKTVALEHKEIITFGSQSFGRVYDEVVEINGNPRYIDQKAWSSAYLDRGLKNELSFKVSATDSFLFLFHARQHRIYLYDVATLTLIRKLGACRIIDNPTAKKPDLSLFCSVFS